jgi:hypothetical protein
MKYFTTKDIADRFSISERRVRQIASEQNIGQQITRGVWIFQESDLVKFQERNTKPGRLPKS